MTAVFNGIMAGLELVLDDFAQVAILMFEYIGVGVIAVSGVRGLVNYIHHQPRTRLILAQGLAMGLEFKLGSEILRTVIVRSLSEIAIVGGIIALRATLTILLHWEIKNEKEDLVEESRERTERTEKAEKAEKAEKQKNSIIHS